MKNIIVIFSAATIALVANVRPSNAATPASAAVVIPAKISSLKDGKKLGDQVRKISDGEARNLAASQLADVMISFAQTQERTEAYVEAARYYLIAYRFTDAKKALVTARDHKDTDDGQKKFLDLLILSVGMNEAQAGEVTTLRQTVIDLKKDAQDQINEEQQLKAIEERLKKVEEKVQDLISKIDKNAETLAQIIDTLNESKVEEVDDKVTSLQVDVDALTKKVDEIETAVQPQQQ